jgi:hypothetical protein
MNDTDDCRIPRHGSLSFGRQGFDCDFVHVQLFYLFCLFLHALVISVFRIPSDHRTLAKPPSCYDERCPPIKAIGALETAPGTDS